jgi:type I restriction enzyme M protein
VTLTKGVSGKDLHSISFEGLLKKFQRSHDAIWEGGKRDPAASFDEFSKLLMAKIYDERFTQMGQEYGFQTKQGEEKKEVARRIVDIYDLVKERNSRVFKVPIDLPDQIVFEIVELLQEISLRQTDLDIKGRAFEKFLGKIFRDESGQYFTPREVVRFMVDFLGPTERDVVIDPACGSGGFLLYSLIKVMGRAKHLYGEDRDSINRIVWDFAHKQMFGIEINDRIARIAMMDMVIHEDGHSNIECNNALSDYADFEKERDIRPSMYTLILTNPPFGAIVKDRRILDSFQLGKGFETQKTEILFIERCLDLLKDGGRMGIVLPDSILRNSSLMYVREFILSNAKVLGVVSLPSHAFVPSGAGVKSSLLFLEKHANVKEGYPVFMAISKHIGFDSRGSPDDNDLTEILDDWAAYSTGITELRKGSIVLSKDLAQNLSPHKFLLVESQDNRNRKTLAELCDGVIFTGNTPPRKGYTTSGHKTLKVRDLTGKGIEWENEERGFVSHDFFLKHQKKILLENDILLISSAHHPKYIGEKIDIVDWIPPEYKNELLCTAEIMVIRVSPEIIDPYYVMMYLKTKSGFEAVQSVIRGQTAHIYPKDIGTIEIPIPSKNEMDRFSVDLKELKSSLKRKSEAEKTYLGRLGGLKSHLERS